MLIYQYFFFLAINCAMQLLTLFLFVGKLNNHFKKKRKENEGGIITEVAQCLFDSVSLSFTAHL